MAISDQPTQVHPGMGVVAHLGSAIVLVLPQTAEQRGTTKTLLDASREAADAGGVSLVRRLAGALGDTAPEDAPPVAVVADAGAGGELAILLHGAIDALVHRADGTERLSGADVPTWIDRVLSPGWQRIDLLSAGAEPPPHDPFLDLHAGTVGGAGITLVSSDAPEVSDASAPETEPSPAVASEPPPPPVTAEPDLAPREFVAVSFDDLEDDEDDDGRAPLKVVTADVQVEPEPEASPTVLGIVCKNDHFNDPDVLYCAICGISMAQQTANLVEGPRPALGVLVLDDGTTFLVDSDYVIGREPHHAPEVVAGDARPLALADTQRTLSRVHARLVLDGWRVLVLDAGSSNGTYVASGDAQQWTPVGSQSPVPIRPGTHLLVGHRTFVFETHRGTG